MNDMYNSYVIKCDEIWETKVSIDRIDNKWHYCKDNCRWIDIAKQSSNRDMDHYLEYKWKRQTIRERSKELSIPEWCLRNRILYYWMDTEKALTMKVLKNFWNPEPMVISYQWNKYTVKEIAEILPYSRKTIYRMIKSWKLNVISEN